MSTFDIGEESLTNAESAVLVLVDNGLSNHQIAVELSVAIGTVKCHLHRVFEKLQARNRTEAAAKARARGQLVSGRYFAHVRPKRNFR